MGFSLLVKRFLYTESGTICGTFSFRTRSISLYSRQNVCIYSCGLYPLYHSCPGDTVLLIWCQKCAIYIMYAVFVRINSITAQCLCIVLYIHILTLSCLSPTRKFSGALVDSRMISLHYKYNRLCLNTPSSIWGIHFFLCWIYKNIISIP